MIGATAADARVNGVATRFEDLERGLRGQVVSRGDHVARTDNPIRARVGEVLTARP